MRAIRVFAGILGTLIALLLVFALCVMQWPSLLVNSHTLALAARLAQKRFNAPEVKWNQANVEVHHRGLFSNQLILRFQDLCFKDPSYGYGCFENLNSAFAYGFHGAFPRLIELGPVQAHARQITLQVPEKKAEKKSITVSEKQKPAQSRFLSNLIADAKLEPVEVRVDQWTFTLPNLQLAGSYLLEGSSALTSRIDLSVRSHALGGALNSQVQILAHAQTTSARFRGPWKAQAALAAISLDKKSKLTLHSEIAPGQQNHFDYHLNGRYFSPLGKADLEMTGWMLPQHEVHGEIRGQIEPTPAQRNAPLSLLSLLQMNRFQFEGCRFDFIHPEQQTQDGKFLAGCFVDSQIVHFRLLGQKRPPIKLWRSFGVELTANVAIPAPAHSSSPFKGELALAPKADKSSPIQPGGQLASHFEVMPGELPVPRQLRTAVDLSMSISQFQRLVRALNDTPIAVPAPFRSLEGTTSMRMRGNLTLNEGGILALDLGSHLNQDPDHLNVTGKGEASIEALKTLFEQPSRLPQVDARLDITLNDIHLTLPKFGISPPPDQVLPDPRIHTSVANATTEVKQRTQHGELAGIHYQIRVTTPQDHPIQIASEHMKKPITVGLDLRLRQDRPWMGFATINGNKEPVGVPSSEMAGQAAESRVNPKLPFGFSQLVSSLLTGAPYEWVSTQPQTGPGVLPKKEETRIGSALEFRRRY